MRMWKLFCLALPPLAVALTTPSDARAQAWPSRPVTIVVPFNAGSAPDIVARLLAEELSSKVGQSVVVDNRVGASGNLGAQAVARSVPDGYTLLLSTPTPLGLNKLMQANIQYDPEKDLVPIVVMAKSPQFFVAGKKSNAKSLLEIIALAKEKPGVLTVGIPGIGTTGHIAIEALLAESNASMTMVPYRGAPGVTDVLSGQIDMSAGPVAVFAEHVKSGNLIGLAVTSSTRSEQLPDVPTVAELGFTGFEATLWYVLAAPTGTPQPIIDRINRIANEYMHTAEGKKPYNQLDLQLAGGTPQEAKEFVASELVKWAPVIRRANIRF